jgi:hypothetical protein
MRKNSDLVSLALAAAALATAILLSPWATRGLSPADDSRGAFAAGRTPAAPREACNVPDGMNAPRACAVVTPQDNGVLTAKAGKPF